MSSEIKTVAIIGGGPAGAALGTLLARGGYKVGIFHTGKRPPLIVGESMLPAVVPMLRALGIEDEVKSFSIHKPGATVCLGIKEIISASFSWADGSLPDYAYNTPRDLFDQAVLNAAERAGAKIFRANAHVERGDEPDAVRLSSDTLEAAGGFFGGQPDRIVDASGRSRTISKALNAPTAPGGRNDVALFAHLDQAIMTDPGNIHIDYLTQGWSWRIPLPNRVSCGIVLNPGHLEKYGSSIEAQYDGFLQNEPSMKFYTDGARRITPVVKYNNYQLISEQMYGPNWAMVGDAAGFLDPVFSTGVFLGMRSAFELFKTFEDGTRAAMGKYQAARQRDLRLWQAVIESWYDGRLFNLYRAGETRKDGFFGSKVAARVQKRLVRIFTGQAADDAHDITVFEHLMSLGTLLRDPKDLVIA